MFNLKAMFGTIINRTRLLSNYQWCGKDFWKAFGIFCHTHSQMLMLSKSQLGHPRSSISDLLI